MLADAPNLNYLWCELMIEELARCGVNYFCIAPGSRSAALISAAARNRKVGTFVHYDERGLAFHAVGYMSGSGKPAALILTSGTAVANALPAVIEASKKKLPLVVLTADRPPELQKTGAGQTIEQEGVYGAYVRWAFNMPCPSVEVPASFILTTMDQAVARAQGELPGPVHLNCQFREPLSPEKQKFPRKAFVASLASWQNGVQPFTSYIATERMISPEAAKEVSRRIGQIDNGIIAIGKLRSFSEVEAVLEFSERMGFPIFPDVTSGLRLGCSHANVIPYFDQLLLSPTFMSSLNIDGVIHIGGRMTSKRFYEFCGSQKEIEYVSVIPHLLRNDPLHRVTMRVQAGAEIFTQSVLAFLGARKESWALPRLRAANRSIGLLIGRALSKKALSEMAVARVVSRLIPKGTGLFLSNSMPLRDMDMYADPAGQSVVVGGNRGASGIDGIIASAAGFAVGVGKPVTLVIGDQAFLHDLNSLTMLSKIGVPLTIILINNDGGGIFSFLPIANDQDVFKRCIAAPHGLSFRKAAEFFGLPFIRPLDMSGLGRAYSLALKKGAPIIIEYSGNRQANLRAHQTLQRKITEMLSLRFVAV